MATYNFTGSNGDPLPAGVTSANGTFEIQSNRAQAIGADPGGVKWLLTVESQADGTFEADIYVDATGAAYGLTFRGSDNDNLFYFGLSESAQVVYLFRREAGVFNQIEAFNVTLAVGNTYNLRAVCSGGNVVCSIDGVEAFNYSNVTFNQTATKVGVRFNQAGGAVDTLIAPDSTSTENISIITQSYRHFRQSSGSVTITGSYSGSPISIERSVDGGAWETAVASPSGDAWSDTFTLPAGQYSITYRFSNDVSVNATVNPIGVGWVMAGAGQSNHEGIGESLQTFSDSSGGSTAFMFGNDDSWKKLSDPWDSGVNQVDQVSLDGNAAGSWLPRFANYWLKRSDTPPCFVPCPRSGSEVQEWQKDDTTNVVNGLNLYQSMTRRINTVGGVDVVFYQQGERDARDVVATPKATYKSKLTQFCNDVNADFGCEVFIVPLHRIYDSAYDGNGVTTGQAAIRAAQVEVAEELSFVRIGQSLDDLDISVGSPDDNGNNDNLHFITSEIMDTVGKRMEASYNGSELSLSVSGVPDGSHYTILLDANDNVIHRRNITYYSGVANMSALPVDSGSLVRGVVDAGNTVLSEGCGVKGETN